MILAIILLVLGISFFVNMYVTNQKNRIISLTILSLVNLFLIIITSLNFYSHFGMEKKIENKKTYITSLTEKSPIGISGYKEVKKSKNGVLIFKIDNEQKKPNILKPSEKIDNSIKNNEKIAKPFIENTKTSYIYKNSFYKLLFAFGTKNNEIISENNVLNYSKNNWMIIDPENSKL